jgi:hypothetical protein
MAIVTLKAWYLEQYEPIKEIIKRSCELRLNRNSLLKFGLRADFLNDRQEVEKSRWFARYLEGDKVEFYIEGSGNYLISNLDLVSQEIYFSKQEMSPLLEPILFLSSQNSNEKAKQAIITALTTTIAKLNEKSRLSLSLEISQPPSDKPKRLSSNLSRKISKSLLFIADTTPIAVLNEQLLLSPNVCVDIGCALQTKNSGQILLVNMARIDLPGEFPFDLSEHQQLSFKDETELKQSLPVAIENLLQKFNLF